MPQPIPLVGEVFTPPLGVLGLFDSVTTGNPIFAGHALLQLNGRLTAATETRLSSAGITILEHVTGLTYLVRVRGHRQALDLAIEPVGPDLTRIPAAAKITKSVGVWSTGKPTNKYLIRAHRDTTDAELSAALATVGVHAAQSPRCRCWTASLTRAQVDQVAALDVVRRVEPDDPTIVGFTHELRQACGVDHLQGFKATDIAYGFDGLSGKGVLIGIMDLGIASSDHPAYKVVTGSAALSQDSRYTADSASGTNLHAAWLAGIIGGNGRDTPDSCGGGWNLHGIAPEAKMFGIDVHARELDTLATAVIDRSADILNDSWGVQDPDDAGFISELTDEAVWGSLKSNTNATIPARASVWAVGNSGTETTTASSQDSGYFGVHNPQKNGIVVGGSVVDWSASPMTSLTRWDGSSIGPTLDGRLKPDLMAPACKVTASDGKHDEFIRTTTLYSAGEAKSDEYESTGECGTSFSAAVVSGIASLLVEDWKSLYGDVSLPRPATLKAVLIQGAQDMTASSLGPFVASSRLDVAAFPGPDYATGYGEVDAEASRAVVHEQRLVEDSIAGMDDARAYRVTVPAGAPRLRVTLAWDDPPASDTDLTAPKLEDDLDLTVEGPAGASMVHRPWVLPALTRSSASAVPSAPSGLMAATTGGDHVNNVEQVEIETPAAGTYTVRVVPYDLPMSVDQPFSVASDFPLETAVDTTTLKSNLGNDVIFMTPLKPPTEEMLKGKAGTAPAILVPLAGVFQGAGHDIPSCKRYGNCPKFTMDLSGIPRGWSARIVDDRGRPAGSVKISAKGPSRATLQRAPGRALFLALRPSKKGPQQPAQDDKQPLQFVPGSARQ